MPPRKDTRGPLRPGSACQDCRRAPFAGRSCRATLPDDARLLRSATRDYFGGMIRTDPIRIFVGSTVGFAAFSAATVTPSSFAIVTMKSPFLTV